VKLRSARMEDAELLLSWRNDPVTRSFSRNALPVDRTEHLEWLRRTLEDPARKLFIAEERGVPVGTVRADFDGRAHELSWTVAPEARGRSVGRRMVQLLVRRAGGPLRAQIKASNSASIRIAETAGMHLAGEREGMLQYERP